MKILMINVVCGIRSTGRICIDLASALEAEGHEVKIAYGREDVPEQFKKYAVRIGTDFDVKLHALKARMFDASGFGSKSATLKFIKWVKEYNPDIIHLHNIHGYYINVEILFNYLKTCNKKIIWTLHDCWAFTGHTAYCDAVNCTKWKEGCYSCPQIKEYPKSFIDRSKNNWINKKKVFTDLKDLTIITPSHWLEGLVKESFLKNYPVKVIHNGIDTKKFKPLENDFKEFYGIADKTILLGVATAWDENKGYSDFLRLASLLGDKYSVVLVGVSEAQKNKLPNNVIGIQKTNSIKELSYIYSAADYVLNLSKTENYPTINLEAMCCDTPVITYNVGGSQESVLSTGGIVVEKGNLEAVVEAIKYKKPLCKIDKSKFDNAEMVKEYVDEILVVNS